MEIEFSLSPASHDIHFLTRKINEEAKQLGIKQSIQPFAFYIRNPKDEIIAGCNGVVIYGAIYTDQLWVHPDYRSNSLGRQLMEKVHAYGQEIGCEIATVATMSFQNAQGFYQKLGYQVDFERPGYINGAICLFLRKKL